MQDLHQLRSHEGLTEEVAFRNDRRAMGEATWPGVRSGVEVVAPANEESSVMRIYPAAKRDVTGEWVWGCDQSEWLRWEVNNERAMSVNETELIAHDLHNWSSVFGRRFPEPGRWALRTSIMFRPVATQLRQVGRGAERAFRLGHRGG